MASKKVVRLMRESGLTAREIEIAELVGKGFDDQEISGFLSITQCTVKNHVKKVYKKLDVHTRAKLVALLHK